MIALQFGHERKVKVLCLGAHCDDIEIGCGASLLQLIERQQVEQISWVVFASNPDRKKEALNSARAFLKDLRPEQKEIAILAYKDAFLKYSAEEIKSYFEQLKKSFDPDLIFTHYQQDRHQDHRLIAELSWNTFRHHLILEYEIPKYDADLAQPNCFFQLSADTLKKKNELLLQHFPSQNQKHWFDAETFTALMRIRGLECASPTRYAEAFHVRKWVVG